ncbi:MAG: ATP-binding cassette domain-containing protein [Proteobacteria bacterium]|nr:ATP-binding cassette domain-containing protein [Pseudomonadota bacterium]
MIRAQGLSKSFGKVHAVDNISFDAEDGKITALLGPNGAGKSTTLRMLYTVLKPDAGLALIDGVDNQADLQAARRKLGVLPHSAGLYPHLTALENIRYYGRLSGLENPELERRVTELSAVLDLGPIANRHAKGFSQGERTRVALARALVHQPKNLLLDEPTNHLDPQHQLDALHVFRRAADNGATILASLHDVNLAARFADRCLLLYGDGRWELGATGEILSESRLSELYATPMEAVAWRSRQLFVAAGEAAANRSG